MKNRIVTPTITPKLVEKKDHLDEQLEGKSLITIMLDMWSDSSNHLFQAYSNVPEDQEAVNWLNMEILRVTIPRMEDGHKLAARAFNISNPLLMQWGGKDHKRHHYGICSDDSYLMEYNWVPSFYAKKHSGDISKLWFATRGSAAGKRTSRFLFNVTKWEEFALACFHACFFDIYESRARQRSSILGSEVCDMMRTMYHAVANEVNNSKIIEHYHHASTEAFPMPIDLDQQYIDPKHSKYGMIDVIVNMIMRHCINVFATWYPVRLSDLPLEVEGAPVVIV